MKTNLANSQVCVMATPQPNDSPEGEKQLLYFQENVLSNSKSLYFIKSTLSSIAGATAGLLGLTNFSGFLFYFVTTAVLGALIVVFHCKSNPSLYFRKGAWDPFVTGAGENAMGFMLWWTLMYAIVHVYE